MSDRVLYRFKDFTIVALGSPTDFAYDIVARDKQGVIVRGWNSFSDDYAITNAREWCIEQERKLCASI